MKSAHAVKMPLLNPNEVEAVITQLAVKNGDRVEPGDTLAWVETTKANAEVQAEAGGVVVGLAVKAGQTLRAGAILLWLAESEDWQPPQSDSPPEPPDALRLTNPARQMAQAAGIDEATLPIGPLVTVEWLEQWLAGDADLPSVDEGVVVVYGGGGHGKAVIELIRAHAEFDIAGVIDDGLEPGAEILGVPVLGGADHLQALRRQGIGQAVNAVGGIGNIGSRVAVFDKLRAAAFRFPSLVHPWAFVEASATLNDGVQVFPHAYIGSEAGLGFGVIVNTAAVISHDCVLEAYANIAPGSMLAGAVRIGERSLVGMGVTINLDVKIGEGSRLGNSSVIKESVPAGTVVPAGSIWPLPDRS